MVDDVNGCSPLSSAHARADEWRWQARIVDDLFDRLGTVVRSLPHSGDLAGWRGPAAEAFAAAVAEQEATLVRETYRLDSVRTQLRGAAALAEAETHTTPGYP